MAILKSINSNSILLRPIRYENPKESWLIAEVVLKSNEVNTKSIGSYINKYELLDLIKAIDLVIKNRASYTSNFIEPNLEIKINYIEDNILVLIKFSPMLEYDESTGKIIGETYFEMNTSKDELEKFKLSLENDFGKLE